MLLTVGIPEDGLTVYRNGSAFVPVVRSVYTSEYTPTSLWTKGLNAKFPWASAKELNLCVVPSGKVLAASTVPFFEAPVPATVNCVWPAMPDTGLILTVIGAATLKANGCETDPSGLRALAVQLPATPSRASTVTEEPSVATET